VTYLSYILDRRSHSEVHPEAELFRCCVPSGWDAAPPARTVSLRQYSPPPTACTTNNTKKVNHRQIINKPSVYTAANDENIVILKYQASTLMLSLCIKYSTSDQCVMSVTVRDPRSCDIGRINDVRQARIEKMTVLLYCGHLMIMLVFCILGQIYMTHAAGLAVTPPLKT